MADDQDEKIAKMIRDRLVSVSPTDVAIASFHQGSHPQRPIPPDLTDEEKRFLDAERARIHSTNRVPDEEPGRLPGTVNAPVLANPARPNAGVLFTGATAREESLLRGIDPKVLDSLDEERAKRLDPEQSDETKHALEQAAAARNERRSAPEAGPEPDMPFATDATIRAVAQTEGKDPPSEPKRSDAPKPSEAQRR